MPQHSDNKLKKVSMFINSQSLELKYKNFMLY